LEKKRTAEAVSVPMFVKIARLKEATTGENGLAGKAEGGGYLSNGISIFEQTKLK